MTIVGLLSAFLVSGADFPQAEISNGSIHAKLYLPNEDRGYYRGTRFDWSGVIESLTYKGHTYFGKWFARYSPTQHDAIMGPVEEFRSEDGALGYDEAKPGGYFMKIGVGILRKPYDAKYSFARPYQIVTRGKRVVRPEADRVVFLHELSDGDGYAYTYQKTVRLARNKPELILEHSLKNTGKRVIDTSVYDHDFFMLDGEPTGPNIRVRFAFSPKAETGFKDKAEWRGNELVYKRELAPRGDSVASWLTGFGATAKDNDFLVENTKTGAGVRQIGDRPLSQLNFWSIHTTVCPEAYIHMRIEPGRTFKWKIVYKFYTFAPGENHLPGTK
ncbi:MAG TPA: hypothetical protein VK493_06935 [Bryobacteraceae bacterium]|nr:hypothetical protein [Bryobacteraceae bacterium]